MTKDLAIVRRRSCSTGAETPDKARDTLSPGFLANGNVTSRVPIAHKWQSVTRLFGFDRIWEH
jgi:hypothetical protein